MLYCGIGLRTYHFLLNLAAFGHANLNTTKIYLQPTAEELAERVEQLPLNAYEDGANMQR